MTDFVRPSRDRLLELKGRTLTIRALLDMFGTRVRNHQTVPMILEALREAGLDTVPSFTTCGFTTDILLVARQAAPARPSDHDANGESEEEDEVLPGTLPQQSFKIGDLPSASAGVYSVRPDANLSAATHIMRQRNFSQLPVIDGISDLRGVITWSSIAAQYEKGITPNLGNSMVKEEIPVAEVHQELFPRLPELRRHGYLLVRNNSGNIVGIITGADITGRFHLIALPFFLVGEIEFRLRRCLGPKLTGEPVRALKGRNHSGDFSHLMFGEYVRLLNGDQANERLCQQADDNWRTLGWSGVDRTQFVAQLDRVRSIRNQIAHFDEQALSEQQISELTEFSGLLKQLL